MAPYTVDPETFERWIGPVPRWEVRPPDVRRVGDIVLRQPAIPVEAITDALLHTARRCMIAMYHAGVKSLSAPQIGVQKCLIVWDVGQGPCFAVNPELTTSDATPAADDACASFTGAWPVDRPDDVVLRGIDLSGNEREMGAVTLLAHRLHHEREHLDGVVPLDHVTGNARRLALREVRHDLLFREDDLRLLGARR